MEEHNEAAPLLAQPASISEEMMRDMLQVHLGLINDDDDDSLSRRYFNSLVSVQTYPSKYLCEGIIGFSYKPSMTTHSWYMILLLQRMIQKRGSSFVSTSIAI